MKNKIRNYISAVKLCNDCDRRFLIFKTSFMVLGILLSYASIFMRKKVIDILVAPDGEFTFLILVIAGLLAIDLLNLGIGAFQSYYYPKIDLKMNYDLQKKLITTISRVRYSKFDSPEFHDSMELALKETGGLTKTVDVMLGIISNLVNLVAALILCLSYDWIIPLILVVSCIPYWLVRDKLNKYSYDISKENNAIGRRLSGFRHILTSNYYAGEVRSFGLLDFLLKKYEWEVDSRKQLINSSNKKKNFYSSMLSVIYALVNSVTYLRVAVRTFTKALTLGEFTVVASYVSKVQGSLSGLIDNVLNVTERNMYLGNLFTFFSLAESEDDSDKISLAGKKAHRIEFRNVSFSYPTNPDKKVLKNVSFVIRPYESVLLMGENGAGKTTIIKLINGFYDNYDGDILIDGINIRELKPSSMWREISCMFQDCNLLPITLRENVFFGDEGLQAKYKVGDYEWFDSIVNKYPNHLDTVLLTYLYPNGVEPSGGEKQRIKLYRSIIKDSGVIILDEPTSAIDTETEEQVVRGIRDISKTRTCIIVSHNLSCAVTTDKIIHLKDGVICEEGSHKELMEADGEYKRLFEIKKRLYDEEE